MADEELERLKQTGQSFLVALDSVTGKTFSTSLRIGRHSDNDLVIDHPMISSWHAAIEWDGERWRIKDLGSSNGTSVNEKRVKGRRVLKEGDVIRFAGVSRWRAEVLVPPDGGSGTGVTQPAQDRPGEKVGELHLTRVRPGEGTVRVVHASGEWSVTTGQRFLLLYVLANAAGDWIHDEDLKVLLWGKQCAATVDPSALHKLIYDTRRMFALQYTDGWCIEKAGGRTRLNLPRERVHFADDS